MIVRIISRDQQWFCYTLTVCNFLAMSQWVNPWIVYECDWAGMWWCDDDEKIENQFRKTYFIENEIAKTEGRDELQKLLIRCLSGWDIIHIMSYKGFSFLFWLSSKPVPFICQAAALSIVRFPPSHFTICRLRQPDARLCVRGGIRNVYFSCFDIMYTSDCTSMPRSCIQLCSMTWNPKCPSRSCTGSDSRFQFNLKLSCWVNYLYNVSNTAHPGRSFPHRKHCSGRDSCCDCSMIRSPIFSADPLQLSCQYSASKCHKS